VLHRLERADRLPELLALVRVRHCPRERALRKADHLRRDANAPLVQDLDRDLVALANLADHVFSGDAQVVEVERARRRGTDTEFLLFLRDLDALVLARNKASDAFVPL
jgi:hypothetical protein